MVPGVSFVAILLVGASAFPSQPGIRLFSRVSLEQNHDTIRIPSKITCASCRIKLTSLVTLGGDDPPDISVVGLTVVRLRNGEFVTTAVDGIETLAVFGRDGRFRRRIGRPGQGPGEWARPVRVIQSRWDSIFVVDAARRISILTSDGRFVRSVRTPGIAINNLIELPNGDMLAAGTAFSKEGLGYPLHLIDRGSGASRPLGEPLSTYNPEIHQPEIRRQIGSSGDNSVWVARYNRYILENRSNSGDVRQVFARNVDWFRSWQGQPFSGVRPANSAISGIAEDSTGLIWVFVSVPKTRSTPMTMPRERDSLPADFLLIDFLNQDTRIEVLDPKAGTLVATLRIEGPVRLHAPFPLVGRIELTADGIPVFRLYEVQLIRRTR